MVFLHGREMRDGRAELSGTVRVTVLYTPEGEGGIRTLEFAMPFTVESDGRAAGVRGADGGQRSRSFWRPGCSIPARSSPTASW